MRFQMIFGIVLNWFAFVDSQTPVKILILIEENDSVVANLVNEAVSEAEKKFGGDSLTVDVSSVVIERDFENASLEEACASLYRGVSLILDMTWTGWHKLRLIGAESSIIYVRGDNLMTPYVQAVDDFLTLKNATDTALVFETDRELNQTLYYLIGHSIIRLIVLKEITESTAAKIRAIRPSPSYYVVYASTTNMETIFKAAIDGGLVKRDGLWNLVFTDYNYENFQWLTGDANLNVTVNLLTVKKEVCCRLMGESACTCSTDFQPFPRYFKRLIGLLVSVMSDVKKSGVMVEPKVIKCNGENNPTNDTTLINAFDKTLKTRTGTNDTFQYLEDDSMMITYRVEIDISEFVQGRSIKLAEWSHDKKVVNEKGMEIKPARRFFRIGTAQAIPWSYVKRDPETLEPILDSEGNEIWEGYCIDLMKTLATEMDFDYELVVPRDGKFGEKKPETVAWTGIVGDLLRGETDIAIAALTMTSEREEVIDFVAPYFEQSGILIVIRKPVRATSLFKFMTVLRVEVWLSIVGALTVTGIMIWLLDKYSPYSARNNKKLYPYPCREFTLKESFWFALTSFTPQGGGEAPKALSGRTLVAAYWLFVVLMLATFTANLAAFLTVERMQSPVQSLEQLARQSRINYTVMENSHTHQYFVNMKNAEDKLYNVWKEITLNSSSEQVEYRVWDYPIKEQYGHILQAITQAVPVESARVGFQKVVESENAEFAFIHDSAEIKYEVTRNCNLTEVGEVFAEQPYAIAVQQGSHLQEEISRRILDLQKDRYFEALASKYWNQSLRASCPNSDDSEGITLESLGGVFIATLFGLALAMITLAGEVIYYRKRAPPKSGQKPPTKIRQLPTLNMKPAPVVSLVDRPFQGIQPRVSHISVYPRNFPYKE